MEKFKKRYLPESRHKEYNNFWKTNNPIKRLELLIRKSISVGASDIHIEPIPYEKEDIEKGLLVQIRIRIGGDLKYFYKLTNDDISGIIKMGEDYDTFVRGIKHPLGLGQTDGSIPLDASYSLKDEKSGIDINLRFSFLPEGIDLPSSVGFFPKIVIRILDNNKNIIKFEDLGLLEHDKKNIDAFLQSKQGFLIMAGPTGSGKTTTLYSMLQEINTPEKNIQTLEDPIEYRIPGINQSRINHKSSPPYDFALGLRAILRQDPDIILIGEIRDKETGKIAIESASTGHLVFSTLHANSSIEIYSRLIQMEIEKYQVINGVNIGFSQRLVKKVCPHCAKKVVANEKYKEEFKKLFFGFNFSKLTKNDFIRLFLGKMSEATADNLEKTFKILISSLEEKEYKLLDDKNNASLIQEIDNIKKKIFQLNENIYYNLEKVIESNIFLEANLNEDNTCEVCHGEGYKGRIGIFEVVPNTEELGELLLNNASKKELNKYVEKNSIFTLKRYAFLRLLEGKIDFNEYLNIN